MEWIVLEKLFRNEDNTGRKRMPPPRRFNTGDPYLNDLLESGLATLEYAYPKSYTPNSSSNSYPNSSSNASIRTGSGLGSSTYTSTSRITASTTATTLSRGGLSINTTSGISDLTELACQCPQCLRLRRANARHRKPSSSSDRSIGN